MIVPGITHWNHPRFFAYFSISAAPVTIMAEALAAALDVNAMLWRTSPAATELEDVTLGWLREMLGLPAAFHGIIYDTASISGYTALAAARESLGLEIRERGMGGRSDLPALRSRRTRVKPSAPGRPTSITASANSSSATAACAASALATRCTE